jgi:hypothetical protein
MNGKFRAARKGVEETKKQRVNMTIELKKAIDAYVSSLPDLYGSTSDDSRLLRIVYELNKVESVNNDEFNDYFISKLSGQFEKYSKETIEKFYEERKEKISRFDYVVGLLKKMDLLK